MDEKDIKRELFEILSILKCIERKMSDGSIPVDKDIFVIHMAVLQSYYDMSEALEFIKGMYRSDEE